MEKNNKPQMKLDKKKLAIVAVIAIVLLIVLITNLSKCGKDKVKDDLPRETIPLSQQRQTKPKTIVQEADSIDALPNPEIARIVPKGGAITLPAKLAIPGAEQESRTARISLGGDKGLSLSPGEQWYIQTQSNRLNLVSTNGLSVAIQSAKIKKIELNDMKSYVDSFTMSLGIENGDEFYTVFLGQSQLGCGKSSEVVMQINTDEGAVDKIYKLETIIIKGKDSVYTVVAMYDEDDGRGTFETLMSSMKIGGKNIEIGS